jgi:Ca2+-binding EF-hand superfamily protein
MLLALGAASSAMDALQSLLSSKSASPQTTGFTQNPPTPFDTANGSTQTESPPPVTGGAGFTQISPATMSALIAAQSQDSSASTTSASTTSASTTSASTDPTSALKDLFSQIDANGDGQISKTEFENALGAGGTNLAQADDVFNKLDANGDGSVSLDEMQKALQGAGGGHHHHHHVAASDDSTSTDGTNSTAGASGSGGAGGSNSDPLLQALAGATSTSVTNSDGSTTTSITNADGSVITMTSPAATTSSGSATASYNFLEQMIQRAAQAVSAGAASSLSLNV